MLFRSPEQDTKIGIDVFLEMFASQLEVVHKGYQLIVKKVANQSLGEEQTLLSLGWEKLGDAATDAGYLDAAIERYETAIKIKSGNYLTYHKLGKSLQTVRTQPTRGTGPSRYEYLLTGF